MPANPASTSLASKTITVGVAATLLWLVLDKALPLSRNVVMKEDLLVERLATREYLSSHIEPLLTFIKTVETTLGTVSTKVDSLQTSVTVLKTRFDAQP